MDRSVQSPMCLGREFRRKRAVSPRVWCSILSIREEVGIRGASCITLSYHQTLASLRQSKSLGILHFHAVSKNKSTHFCLGFCSCRWSPSRLVHDRPGTAHRNNHIQTPLTEAATTLPLLPLFSLSTFPELPAGYPPALHTVGQMWMAGAWNSSRAVVTGLLFLENL